MASEVTSRLKGKLRALVAPRIEAGDHHACIMAVASNKGGVGKTTTVVNLAHGFSKMGLRTLVIDLDPQAHIEAALQSKNNSSEGLADILTGKRREVMEVARPSSVEGIDIAGSEKSMGAAETALATKIGRELILQGSLRTTRTHYDMILIDCPPNLGTLTLNGLCAADYLLVPADMSVLAVEGIADILGAVDTVNTRLGRDLEILGVLATRVDRRATRTNAQIAETLDDLFGDVMLPIQIPQSAAVNKAHLANQSVLSYAPSSPGAVAYQELAEWLQQPLSLRTPGAPNKKRKVLN
ncbi:ParA family protein [Myxococcota bacterium]|nr:ParA family protein [Myxococcota bacterium]